MGSRKTLGVQRREDTRRRRENARQLGFCAVCMSAPATILPHCTLGVVGGNWCTAAPDHEHTTRRMTTCQGCRDRKKAKKEASAPVAQSQR